MSPRKNKLFTILVGLALAGVALLTYTQTWFSTHVTSPQGGTVDVTAAGSDAAPALSALSFAGLALFGAITIAGPVFRVILGVLEILLGGCVVLSAVLAVSDPIGAASGAITKVTGVDGDASVRGIVLSHGETAWPWVALVTGVAMAALGLFVVITSRSWPQGTRRYQAIRVVDPNAPTDSVAAWDTLTTGVDPTAEAAAEPEPGTGALSETAPDADSAASRAGDMPREGDTR